MIPPEEFPRLTDTNHRITSPESKDYNCIACAAGDTISPAVGLSIEAGASLTAFGTITAGITNAGAVMVGDGNSTDTLTVTGGYTQSAGTFVLNGPLLLAGTFEEDGGNVSNQTDQASQTYSAVAALQAAAFTQTGGTFLFTSLQNFQIAGDFTFSGGQGVYLYQTASIGRPMQVTGGDLQVNNGSSWTVIGGVKVAAGGTLESANSTIIGNVTNAGTISTANLTPAATGSLTIAGNYTQTHTGVLVMHWDGNVADQLIVSGTASLAGTLQLVFFDGAQAGPGLSLPLITGSIVGVFDAYVLPTPVSSYWEHAVDASASPNVLRVWVADKEAAT